jgi:hypothetical protein
LKTYTGTDALAVISERLQNENCTLTTLFHKAKVEHQLLEISSRSVSVMEIKNQIKCQVKPKFIQLFFSANIHRIHTKVSSGNWNQVFAGKLKPSKLPA